MVAAIDLLLSFAAWQHLRVDQGLDDPAAQQAVKLAIGALLGPEGWGADDPLGKVS